ncbi:MAG: hypothetical protein AAFP00_08565, partial [Bacteroidota bacterium]
FDASALTAGLYNTNLVVCSNDLRNPQVTVPASLYVLSAPAIEVSPDTISVEIFEGFETDAAFTVGNSGETALEYSITDQPGFVTITSGESGTLGQEESAEVTLDISAVGLLPGSYPEAIEISSNDPNNPISNVVVDLNVLDFVVIPMEVEPTCTDNPEMLRAWIVNNPNTFARDAFWFVVGTDQADSITLEPGENTIYTETLDGVPNILRLRWLDGEEVQQQVDSESEGTPCRVRGLILTSVCSNNPEIFRAWEINNRNPFSVLVEWNLVGTQEIGFVNAAPGFTTFFTEALEGENRVKIIWIDEEGNPRRQQKFSTAGMCDIDNSCAGGNIIVFEQGFKKNGQPVSDLRSNPANALGQVEENNGYNFLSLGFNGSVTIGLGSVVVDQPGNDLIVLETSFQDVGKSFESYPESAEVYASADGINFVYLGDAKGDTEFDMAAANLTEVSYVRVVDNSDPTMFGDNADGFDLDGVACVNAYYSQADPFAYSQIGNEVQDEEVTAVVTTFPNPFVDRISVSMDVPETEGKFTVMVYDIFGALVYEGEVSSTYG